MTNYDFRAISPFKEYCDGFMSPGAQGMGYINALKVAASYTKATNDRLLDGITAFDQAETRGSYIGQINMITASSFSGIAASVWGYDIARNEELDNQVPLFEIEQYDNTMMQVYDAGPLLDAATTLFGTMEYGPDGLRYPLAPGAHVICANKSTTAYRPVEGAPLREGEAYGVWSYISLSFARDRSVHASCFIEDTGIWTENDDPEALKAFLEDHRYNVAQCTVNCGNDSQVPFEKSYIGYAYCIMKPDCVGTAITVGPYFSLAQNAVPAEGFDSLRTMSLSEWDRRF